MEVIISSHALAHFTVTGIEFIDDDEDGDDESVVFVVVFVVAVVVVVFVAASLGVTFRTYITFFSSLAGLPRPLPALFRGPC